MHDEHHDKPVGDTNYEPTDAHVTPLLVVGAILVVGTALTFLVGYLLLKYSTQRPAASNFVTSPLDVEREPWDTAGVRLQVDPVLSFQEYVHEELPAVTEFGVISDQPEIYHFPVEVAIDYVAENGLPEFKPFGDGSLEGTIEAAQDEPADEQPAESDNH